MRELRYARHEQFHRVRRLQVLFLLRVTHSVHPLYLIFPVRCGADHLRILCTPAQEAQGLVRCVERPALSGLDVLDLALPAGGLL
jgi:hypothetical protein